tara:strand:- start:1043 stop:1249 length:207 start_codon:yes stop_codon:yes gene_type:complete
MFFKFIFRKKKNFQRKNNSKIGLNDWMNLTKEERQVLDIKEKNESMIKKKALLKSIREEYIKIKKQYQ